MPKKDNKVKEIKMTVTDEEKYKKWKEINSTDDYSFGVVQYLERWADLMEQEIRQGKQLLDIAERTSHEADTEGITGFMYGCAVNILAQLWIHGEELRNWHNKKYNHEGEGVINPAILTVKG